MKEKDNSSSVATHTWRMFFFAHFEAFWQNNFGSAAATKPNQDFARRLCQDAQKKKKSPSVCVATLAPSTPAPVHEREPDGGADHPSRGHDGLELLQVVLGRQGRLRQGADLRTCGSDSPFLFTF